MQAVIQSGSSQFLVKVGDQILVDRLTTPPATDLSFSDVLLLTDATQVQVGQPFIPGAQVTAQVVSHLKGPKIKVSKFKAKSRYRKTFGFRASQSKLTITDIRVK